MSRILLIVFLMLSFCISGCNNTPTEKITICQGGIILALPMLAIEKGYFEKEGIEVSFKPTGDGKLAMDEFMAGKCDALTVGEPPIVKRALEKSDFAIIATVGSSDNATRIVADKRRNISTAADLKGKRVGLRKGNITHFFFDMYLKKHNITPEQLSIRFLEPPQLPEALSRGQIDAYAASDIYLYDGIKRLGERATVLAEPGLCYNTSSLVIKRSLLKEKPELAAKLLRALLKAEKRAAEAPDELISLLAKRREIPVTDAAALLKDQRLVVNLPQHLLLSLEDHASWMQEQGLAPDGALPNFLKFIDDAPLRSIKPSAVNISH